MDELGAETMKPPAGYRKMSRAALARRAALAQDLLSSCTVCPHACRVDRLAGQRGFCRAGRLASVAGCAPHFGEEDVLVGSGGSGTIFFSHCNLSCCFCQNFEISHHGQGEEVDAPELAGLMLSLQKSGCHNINLVSPSHFVPQVLAALCLAADQGLAVPLVYNTGGYDSPATLALLDGVVDIYMPDLKFGEDEAACRYTGVGDYFSVASLAVREMHRQAGDLVTDESGRAVRGLLLRHLVLPQGLAGTDRVMEFVAGQLSVNTLVNIMRQYHPAHLALRIPELARPVTRGEYLSALEAAARAGLKRIYSG